MTTLTKRYRLIWDADTLDIRCCDEFPDGTATYTKNPCFESDSWSDIQAKIETERLVAG